MCLRLTIMTLTVAELDEAQLLERMLPLLPQGHRTVTGPGDDAAVLNVPSGQAVISTDVLVEGHHFRTDWSTPEDVGYRAAVQNQIGRASGRERGCVADGEGS